jgi:light-harvesting complex 1 beta chain
MKHAQVNHPTSSTFVKPLEGLHLVFIVLFGAFLVFAVLGQLLTWNWRTWLPGAQGARSLWDGVMSSVYTVISHLS